MLDPSAAASSLGGQHEPQLQPQPQQDDGDGGPHPPPQPSPSSSGWETMGGDPGDGITGGSYGVGVVPDHHHQQQHANPMTPVTPIMSTGGFPGGSSVPASSSSYSSYAPPAAPTPPPPPSAGSITRFATPSMMQQQQEYRPALSSTSSYVDRSAGQIYPSNYAAPGSYGGGGGGAPYSSPYVASPAATLSSAPSSFVTSSSQPQQQQQQQQPPTPSAAAATTGGTSYAARSQQAYYAQAGGGHGMPATTMMSVAGGGGVGALAAPPAPSPPSSYASRSAQAYAAGPSSFQPPPSGDVAPAGSYAARSAQAYRGAPVPQQPPPQQHQAWGTSSATTLMGANPSAAAVGAGGGTSYSPQGYVRTYPNNALPYSQQQPVYSNVVPNPSEPPSPSSPAAVAPAAQQPTLSYAARSAQAAAISPAVQPAAAYASPMQPQLSQPPYHVSASAAASVLYGGSGEAERSTMMPQQSPEPAPVPYPGQQQAPPPSAVATSASSSYVAAESAAVLAAQHRMLTDATRKVQEHAYYMKQAMEQRNLPVVLDRAAHMVGELGGLPHGHHNHLHQYSASSGPSSNPSSPSASQPQPLSGPTNTGISPKLNPKNYYELYMRALEEMPTFEEYLLNLSRQPLVPPDSIQIVDIQQHHGVQRAPYTMRELYDCTQYCPRVVSRLYLQISAGSALIRSGEVGAKCVLLDLGQAVRCEQNPIRGLFLRNFLLTALRDKLPDSPPPPPLVTQTTATPHESESTLVSETDPSQPSAAAADAPSADEPVPSDQDKGNVMDSIDFVLQNFMEMNKLWVRIQHLPGEGNNKDVRKRRERERNDLRILVGTNLVRLSQLECVTSKIYGEIILPRILEHIVVSGDPLSQAYLMDCLVQVFPDEYHIETLPILLNVCPRLRDKVNIRTILQGLMDRLANYLAEEELLDESDTNQVKKTLARDSFYLFEECVQKVYNARGPKLTAKEVIRLQTALLQFSVKCYPGNDTLISRCLGACVAALRQANASYESHEGTIATVPDDRVLIKSLDETSVSELEKLLSIPLETLVLRVLRLEHYRDLIGFLPWANRREVAINMLKAVDSVGSTPGSVKEITELFSVIEPVMRDEHIVATVNQDAVARASTLMAGLGVQTQSSNVSFNESDSSAVARDTAKENILVSKLVHLLDHENIDVLFEMLQIAKTHICHGGRHRASQTLVAVVFASVRLLRHLFKASGLGKDDEPITEPKSASVGTDPSAADEERVSTNVTTVEATASDAGQAENDDLSRTMMPKPSETEKTVDVESVPTDVERPKAGETATSPGHESYQTTVEESKAELLDTREGSEATPRKEAVPVGSDHGLFPTTEERMKVPSSTQSPKPIVSFRDVFIFIQETLSLISKANPEVGVKLYLEIALVADSLAASSIFDSSDFTSIAYELLSQALSLYEESVTESKAQQRCIRLMVGSLLLSKGLNKEEYEGLITKTAVFSAKVVKKPEQCQLVGLCAYLFYPTQGPYVSHNNPQRALECLQRSLKLADASTSANPSHVGLFVELLEHYVFFFEKKNPFITHNYITGLVALIKEHFKNLMPSFEGDSRAVVDAKGQFEQVIRYIRERKTDKVTSELFRPIQIDQ